MKKMMAVALLACAAASGCAYGGLAASGERVVIARNDGFLFGVLRKVYVCKITDGGVTSCATSEAP
jgi:hypothetical protein